MITLKLDFSQTKLGINNNYTHAHHGSNVDNLCFTKAPIKVTANTQLVPHNGRERHTHAAKHTDSYM